MADESSEQGGDWQGELVRGRLEALNARATAQRSAGQKLLRKAAGTKQAILGKLSPALQKKIKRVQFVLDAVKIISLTSALFTGGLDIFSLSTFFLVANGELLASLFVPYWQMQMWRKMAIIVLDMLAGLLAITIYGLITFIQAQPDLACKELGGVWGGAIGSIKGCSALSGSFSSLFDAILK